MNAGIVSLDRKRASRRQLLAGLGLAAAMWPPGLGCGSSRSAGKSAPVIRRVGLLLGGRAQVIGWMPARFRQELAARGWVEDANVSLEVRFSEGDAERLDPLARELLAANAEVLVTYGTEPLAAARRATSSVPIVSVVATADPVVDGLVQSLERPGGNLTGITFAPHEVSTVKLLELLKEAVPRLHRPGILWNAHVWGPWQTPGEGAISQANARLAPVLVRLLDEAARAQAVELVPMEVRLDPRTLGDYQPAFAAAHTAGVDGVVMNWGVSGNSIAYGQRVSELARHHRLPLVSSSEGWEQFCLLTYAADFDAMWPDAARFVDRILRGARPGDLPFERPKAYKLWLNQRFASALGLTIPPAILGRATEVIQ